MKLAIKPTIKPKKKTVLKALIILLILAIAVAGVLWRTGFFAKGTTGLTYTIEETSVEMGGISQSIEATGTLMAAETYTITSLVSGDILSDTFEEGDDVNEDDVLYTIDSSDTSSTIEKAEISLESAQRSYESKLENLEKLTVTTDVTGTVYELDVEVGDSVSTNQVIGSVRDVSTMTITLPFLSDEAQQMSVGGAASLVMDDTMEVLPATITKISVLDDVTSQNSIVRNVTLSVSNPGGLTPIHSASAEVNGSYSMSSGTLSYGDEGDIRAEIAGEVSAIYVDLGDVVYEGQAILTLTSDDVTDAIDTAEDTVRDAELSLESAMDTLDDYTISSPISGTVVQKNVKAGEVLSKSTSMCVIYDLSSLTMTLNIDELDILNIEKGAEVLVTSESVEGVTYIGTITKVSSIGSTSGGITTYPITVEIVEHEGLMAGMNVNASIITAQSEGSMKIPVAALNRGNTVLVTEDSPSAVNAVEGTEPPEGYVYVAVEVGLSDGSFIEIVSGLTLEDTVATQVADRIETEDFDSSMMGGGMTSGMTGGMSSGMTGGMSSGGMSSGGMSGPGGR